MLVVSIEAYTALCVLIGFLGGAIYASIFWWCRPNKAIQTIPAGHYIVRDGKITPVEWAAEA